MHLDAIARMVAQVRPHGPITPQEHDAITQDRTVPRVTAQNLQIL